MSISKNIGGINMLLSKLRAKKRYTVSNQSGRKVIEKIPLIGKYIVKIVTRAKKVLNNLLFLKCFLKTLVLNIWDLLMDII